MNSKQSAREHNLLRQATLLPGMWVFAGLLGLPILAANLVLERINKMHRNSFHRLKSLLISLAITLNLRHFLVFLWHQ